MICYKSYDNLQLLPVPSHWWKDLSINFVTDLPILTNLKDKSYVFIFVIVNRLIKIIYYKFVKVTINIFDLAKVIINMVVLYHIIAESIFKNQVLLFISKFLSLIFYFLGKK